MNRRRDESIPRQNESDGAFYGALRERAVAETEGFDASRFKEALLCDEPLLYGAKQLERIPLP